ncbi:MAG: GxxExxY protein [Chitinophagaceae bacterium]
MGAELRFKNITEKIIRAAFEVYKFLGNGFQEVIYQRAVAWELFHAGLSYAREIEQDIFYKELQEPIGIRRADFVVEGKVLVPLRLRGKNKNSHKVICDLGNRTSKKIPSGAKFSSLR